MAEAASAIAPAMIAHNLSQAMSAYGRSLPRGSVVSLPSITLVDSGLNYAAFNAAVLLEAVEARSLPAVFTAAADHFAENRRPWSLWVCDDLLTQDQHSALPELLRRRRLRLVAEHQGMALEYLAPPARPLPAMEILAVADRRTRSDFAMVCGNVFSLPQPVARDVYESEGFWNNGLQAWVGYVSSRPVAISAASPGDGANGLYSIGTLPEFRHLGYGERLTRHALAESCKSNGVRRAVLQSTQAGLRLYRQLGFKPLGRFSVYMSR